MFSYTIYELTAYRKNSNAVCNAYSYCKGSFQLPGFQFLIKNNKIYFDFNIFFSDKDLFIINIQKNNNWQITISFNTTYFHSCIQIVNDICRHNFGSISTII